MRRSRHSLLNLQKLIGNDVPQNLDPRLAATGSRSSAICFSLPSPKCTRLSLEDMNPVLTDT
jgi:hypothetical protein